MTKKKPLEMWCVVNRNGKICFCGYRSKRQALKSVESEDMVSQLANQRQHPHRVVLFREVRK